MVRIGLISDTHGFLDPAVFEHFKECNEIWHAGDIGELQLIRELEKVKPVKAVFGNIDETEISSLYPEDLWMEIEGLSVLMTHIAGSPPLYNPRIKKIFKDRKPDILVCGHSHILKIIKDQERDLLFINPGAAGQQGFHHTRTIVRFSIDNKKLHDMEVVELGKRGKL